MGDDIGQNTAFYYNISTGQVEREGQSKAKDLLGPFPTEDGGRQRAGDHPRAGAAEGVRGPGMAGPLIALTIM